FFRGQRKVRRCAGQTNSRRTFVQRFWLEIRGNAGAEVMEPLCPLRNNGGWNHEAETEMDYGCARRSAAGIRHGIIPVATARADAQDIALAKKMGKEPFIWGWDNLSLADPEKLAVDAAISRHWSGRRGFILIQFDKDHVIRKVFQEWRPGEPSFIE